MKRKLFSALAVLTAFTMVAVSCNDKEKEGEDIAVIEVKVTPATGSVVAGETLALEVEVLPKNATNKTVKWTSRDTAVATVSDKGVVTGVKESDTPVEIWATCGGKSGKATITVTAAPIRVETVTLNKPTLALFVNQTEKLTFTIDPANATDQTTAWDSSNKTAVTVAEDGTVTAVAEGTSTITLTIDEKTATCEVTVSIPAMESIATPYLRYVSGNTVTMTAAGFKAGDKVSLEDFFGFTGTADVKNVTATGAEFDLPTGAEKDRSYKLTVLRNNAAVGSDYIRYDDDMVQMAAGLGYLLTASGEVVEDGSIAGLHGSVVRQGYVTPAAVFQYNATDGTFDASAADLRLATFATSDETLVLNYISGVKDLSGMEHFDLSGVKTVKVTDADLEELDMTLFPNCETLHAWGDGNLGNTMSRIKKVNFGTYTNDDSALKLVNIQLERNHISGEVDLRNCIYLSGVNFSDNQIEKINLGSAVGNPDVDTDRILKIYSLSAKNNKLKEIDISNCARIRQLWLEGNKIERATLLNNGIGLCAGESSIPAWMPYMYIFKSPDDLSITWATAAEAEGRERHINVEHYWWRYFSPGNKTENSSGSGKTSFNKWVNNSPVMQAFNDGFKVTCWTYYEEVSPYEVKVVHVHEPGTEVCAVAQDVEEVE